MPLFPSVTAYKDGDDQLVEADVMNVPINQLRERTDWLKGQVDDILGAGPFESVRLTGVILNPASPPPVFTAVCIDPATKYYSSALAGILVTPVYPYSVGTSASYAVGMLVSVAGGTGTVVTYGQIDISAVQLSNLVQSTEKFRNGPYYLSASEAGRLTANPPGAVAAYVGQFFENASNPGYGDFAVITPQIKDLYEAHLHRHWPLAAQPAGHFTSTGTDVEDTWRVRGFTPEAYTQVWAPGQGVNQGDIKVPTAANQNYHCYICTAAGTTGGTEPAWPAGGGTVTDNTVTWTDLGLHSLLNIRGSYSGLSDTYTFWIASTTGNVRDTRIFWQTAGGTDDSWIGAPTNPVYGSSVGLPIPFYEKEVEIGSLGVRVFLELGGIPSSGNFTEVSAGSSADASTTWTIAIPKQAKGWHAHEVCGFMTYTGTTARDYTLQVFGTYITSGNNTAENIRIAVTNDGGYSGDLTADGAVIDLTDVGGVAICTLTGVTFSGQAYHIVNAGRYDLWLVINRTNIAGGVASDTMMAATDSWAFPFTDEAPNAKFEYNIGFDQKLNAYYPPQPLLDVVLEVGGVNMDARDRFFTGVGTYRATQKTLYWYPNDYMKAPWPIDWTGPDTAGDEDLLRNMLLYSAEMRAAETGIVTSLTPKPGSSITLTDKKTGLPAIVGDLELGATFNVNTVEANAAGYMVFKNVDSQGRIQRGPVVEALMPGAGIRMTATSNNGKNQGTVYIEADAAGLTYGDFSDIFMLNAKQEVVPGSLFSYIKLLPWVTAAASNVGSAFVCKFRVPYSLTGEYKVIVYATMFGLDSIVSTDGDNGRKYAGLRFTYSVGTDYSLGSGPQLVAANLKDAPQVVVELVSDVTVGRVVTPALPSVNSYDAYDPFLLHNDPSMTPIEGEILAPFTLPFPLDSDVNPRHYVSAGNIVAVKFERTGTHTGHQGSPVEYTGGLGFVSLKWKLIPVV